MLKYKILGGTPIANSLGLTYLNYGGGGGGAQGPQGPQGLGVSSISFVDNSNGTTTLTFHMTDGSTQGPFTTNFTSDTITNVNQLTLTNTGNTNKLEVLDSNNNTAFNVNTSTVGSNIVTTQKNILDNGSGTMTVSSLQCNGNMGIGGTSGSPSISINAALGTINTTAGAENGITTGLLTVVNNITCGTFHGTGLQTGLSITNPFPISSGASIALNSYDSGGSLHTSYLSCCNGNLQLSYGTFNSSSNGVYLSSSSPTSWTSASKKEYKNVVNENVDHEHSTELLDKLHIDLWSYKEDPNKNVHLGMYAEDVASFGVSTDGNGISTLHYNGILMSSLKGLIIKHNKLLDRVTKLEAIIAKHNL